MILTEWYAGEEAGAAVADVLFREYNAAGCLPVTFAGRFGKLLRLKTTAREGRPTGMLTAPLYCFGGGSSYARFREWGLKLKRMWRGAIVVSAKMKKNGLRASDAVPSVYVTGAGEPQRDLHRFQRIHLRHDEERTVEFTLSADTLAVVNEAAERVPSVGDVQVSVGGSKRDVRSVEPTGLAVLRGAFGWEAGL